MANKKLAGIQSGNARPYDVILYGASGFVGRQTVAYFAAQAKGLRWALAGRSAEKLEQVRADCGAGAAQAGIVVADAADSAALTALAAQTKVVLSTAGPFVLYGTALVAACVAQCTHYVDITGETPWVRTLIDQHHAQAAQDGTRIIPCCGFDSVPSDLGVWLVVEAMWREFGEPCVSVKACHTIRGGVNGGTLASAMNMMEPAQRKRLGNPFLLNPEGTVPINKKPHADPLMPLRDTDFKAWLAPFIMSQINTRVVRRSAALAQVQALAGKSVSQYAEGFVYQEYLRMGKGPVGAAAASGLSLGMGMGQAAMLFKPWRMMAKALMPGPGKGPSERAMTNGAFRCELIGKSASGKIVRGKIADRGDPGNRATTKFLCEAAMALAIETSDLPGKQGGVLTPATGLGMVLAKRLVAAGMTVEPLPT